MVWEDSERSETPPCAAMVDWRDHDGLEALGSERSEEQEGVTRDERREKREEKRREEKYNNTNDGAEKKKIKKDVN